MITLKIGIDPDVKKSGYCLIEQNPFDKPVIRKLTTLNFWDLIEEVSAINAYRDESQTSLIVFLEAGWMNKTKNYHGASNKAIAGRIGANVGENHAIGKLIAEFLERSEITFKLVRPVSSKWSADLFRKITRFERRTNQEERDAVKACW